MPNRTAWTAGNGVGLIWTTAINSADLASLANGSTVLSSVSDILNQTNQDIYADIAVRLAVASATPSAGAYIGIYLVAVLDDGVTYGDGELTSGGTMTRAYPFAPVGTIPLQSSVATTVLAGFIQGIIIPPGSFRFALYNSSSLALSSGTQNVHYRTYNIQLNN